MQIEDLREACLKKIAEDVDFESRVNDIFERAIEKGDGKLEKSLNNAFRELKEIKKIPSI